MNWLLWILAFVSLAVPVGSLTIDRVFGIPARKLWIYWGIPSAIAFAIALGGALATGNGLAALILLGIVSGILASAALDVVRLTSYHVFKAFPLDMPQMFGTIAYGLAPQLQRNVIGQMVKFMAEAPEKQRRMMMKERLPPMMPLVKFPGWFSVIPLIAHLAMAVPIGYIALNYVSPAAHAASLFGALGWLP